MQKEEQAKIDEAEPLNEEELEEKENLLSQVNLSGEFMGWPTGESQYINNIKLLILVWIVLSYVSTF